MKKYPGQDRLLHAKLVTQSNLLRCEGKSVGVGTRIDDESQWTTPRRDWQIHPNEGSRMAENPLVEKFQNQLENVKAIVEKRGLPWPITLPAESLIGLLEFALRPIDHVYVVVYSTYDPDEVDSIHLTEHEAVARANDLNENSDYPLLWEVRKRSIYKKVKDAQD